MDSPKPIRGRLLRVAAPEWEPLLNLAPDHVDDFMWMCSVELKDGTRLQAYKHYWTRDYLHVSQDGRTFAFVPKTRYQEVNPEWLLERVLGEELKPYFVSYSVRQNSWPEEGTIRFARSSTKHRISRQRSAHVVETCGLQFIDRARNRAGSGVDLRILFLGDDLEGVPLEVVAIELEELNFLVIHAMPMRDRFQVLYEEARRWRR
jgi:hypothetical protein